jgi:hypothetical protein
MGSAAYGAKNKSRAAAGNHFFLQRNNATTSKGDMFGSNDGLIVDRKLYDIERKQLKAEEKRLNNLQHRSTSNMVATQIPLDQKISLVK